MRVPFESLEDEVEPKFKLAFLCILGRLHVHRGVLHEEGERVGLEVTHQVVNEVRGSVHGEGVTELPDGESENMAVEGVVAPRRRLG